MRKIKKLIDLIIMKRRFGHCKHICLWCKYKTICEFAYSLEK